MVPLWPADSPKLNADRVHDAEVYNTDGAPTLRTVKLANNIHNPSLEAHPYEGQELHLEMAESGDFHRK